MEWTRSETIGLASASCVFCRGLGLRKTTRKDKTRPCGCVLRAIFRACYSRFKTCVEKAGISSNLTLEHSEGPTGHRFWGRRNEEYIADFELTCRRTLNKDDYELFKWHYLYGADWKLCIQKLGIDKGTFFHAVYKVQERLGHVFRELQPYAMFPLDEYFGGKAQRKIRRSAEDRMVDALGDLEEVVAKTNVVEMPRRNDRVSRNFPIRQQQPKAA